MIKIENLSYSFPKKELYNDISFNIEKGEHCAFIGTSGSGKSTLIEIITDPEKHIYDGKVTISDECKIGFTSQFYKHETSNMTVFDYIAQDFVALQKNLDLICDEMSNTDNLEEVLERYQIALDSFDAIGGNNYENEIIKKLNISDLGAHKDLTISQLSGGEFKLVQLIKEMISNQDLLIMDEPDVFLDFENLTSLKNLINSHKGTLLVVTHSRYLLNHCFNKILHLEDTLLQEFLGNYTEYNLYLLDKKIELQEMAVADAIEIERNAKLIEDLRDIATHNAESVHGKSLKARVKFQERLEARQTKEPFIYVKTPKFNFNSPEHQKEGNLLEVKDFAVSFDELLLENVSFELSPTDKVAIIGPNGTGKTTLLRSIAKNNSNSINFAQDLEVSYLSQAQNETLTDSNTVYDEFFDIGFKTYSQINEYLSTYSFEEEVMTSKISSFSGGEKNTLQLAKISSMQSDVILLDEPSSHLDIYAQIALEQAIKDYNGAVLMVSHDFYFIANCMDYVLFIENNTIRRMSIRKFRQMIYAKYFNKDYLVLEEKMKFLQTNIETAIKDKNFEQARKQFSNLEELVKSM